MTPMQKDQITELLADLAKRQAALQHPALPCILDQNPDCLMSVSTWTTPPAIYLSVDLNTEAGLEEVATSCDESSYYFIEDRLIHMDDEIIIRRRITVTQRLTQDEKDTLTRLGKIQTIYPSAYKTLVCEA